MAGKGVEELVRRALQGSLHRKDGPVYYAQQGPWRVESEPSPSSSIITQRLLHYGTKMLEWRITLTHGGHAAANITGWWIGHGSVSDQTGVNAALKVLGSTLRYHRDRSGGGPRVNPFRVSAGVARSLTSITPPTY
jgi:hypothetical protein